VSTLSGAGAHCVACKWALTLGAASVHLCSRDAVSMWVQFGWCFSAALVHFVHTTVSVQFGCIFCQS